MSLPTRIGTIAGVSLIFIFGTFALAQQDKPTEQERKVKENEVPAAALATLKKLAGSATITEFAEEIEHGGKFYEGSWKAADGQVDALVSEAGGVVEIEESMPGDKVPAAVRAAAEKEAGAGSKVSFERKTVYMYEIHYKKDGKGHESIFTPDGRTVHEEKGGEVDKDEDADDEDKK